MFLANGFNDFLSKPIDTVKLNAALVKWIPKEKQMKITDEGGDDAKTTGGDDAGGIKIEGLNVKKGVAITGGSVESYKNILAVFRNDGIQKLNEIRMCLKTDNLPLYSTYVHALKSAAANIGATELSEMAKALEAAGKQENIEFIRTHNPEVELALESLVRNIGGFLDADRKKEIPVDMAAFQTALAELEEAIDTINPRAIKAAVKNIRPFAQAAGVGGTVENILQHILVGEYDEAVSTIKTLLQEKPQ
jgi:HPt (histidine-containing phosphotransfer) domain-containing protein